MPRRNSTSVLVRLFLLTGLALCRTTADAAEADSNQATPPDDTTLSGARRASEPEPAQLKAIEVVGTRIPTAAAESMFDLHIYDRPRIEVSGQTTVTDFLATLPEVSLSSVESTYLATTVRLRGATLGSALILINGRRTQATTGGGAVAGFFDLSTIPLSLVDRIEILPTGSSAIYGGDALAGVVNIVLRSNFTGAEANVGYKWADNTDEKLYYAGAGWNADRFSMSIMATYSERTSLFGRDRQITASPDYRSLGGPNLGTPSYGVPANVSAISGNLPGLNSSFATVPVGSSGIGLRPSDFVATAGTQNTGSFTRYQSLIPDTHRSGFLLNANYRFNAALELFAEVLASDYKSYFTLPPGVLGGANVPASNPFNPFGATVRVSGVIQGAEGRTTATFSENFLRPVVGARGAMGPWEWELTALKSRDTGSADQYGLANGARLSAALASADPMMALNPFVDGPMASSAILASIYSNVSIAPYKSDATIIDGFARGPLLQLPAGPLTAVLGTEYESSTLERGFKADRTVKALFAELRAPLFVATDERGVKREVLAAQGAARYDNYSDFGSKTTWQAGVEFRPFEALLLRGTHATAFKPPTLYNLAAAPFSAPGPVIDPRRNGETVVVQQILGGNPDLMPTTATTTTLGTVWSPKEARGLNISMTWWKLHIDNGINFPSDQFIVNNESAYPGRVVRVAAPPGEIGQIVSVDGSYVNFGSMREEGIDATVDWKFRTALGEFVPAIAATYLTKFEGASTPGSSAVDRLSRANGDLIFAPRWKGITSVAWNSGLGFNVWLAGRYIGRYYDYRPTRTIGDVWYFDATLEVGIERALAMAKGSLGGLKLLVSGTNLANKLPTYSTYFRGYDVSNYDLVGRTIFVRLQLQI